MSHPDPYSGQQCDGSLTLEPAIDQNGPIPNFFATFFVAVSEGEYAQKSRWIGGDFVGQNGFQRTEKRFEITPLFERVFVDWLAHLF